MSRALSDGKNGCAKKSIRTTGDRKSESRNFVIFDFSFIGLITEDQAAVTAKFKTIEGNTNGKGERDSETGDVVWRKERAPSLKKCSIRIFPD